MMTRIRLWVAVLIVWVAVLIALFAQGAGAAGRVFYDGFESGNTNLWTQDDYRNRCSVVTSSTDGVAGPYSGTYMARCNWDGTVAGNTPTAYETLRTDYTYTNELFIRIRYRRDQNTEATDGSPLKFMRIFYWVGDFSTYRDMFEDITSSNGLSNRGNAGNTALATYWGGTPGDNTASSASWHMLEYYFNHATGKIRVWHNNLMIRDDTVSFNSQKWNPFYITSNWADDHDSTNHLYFDEVEIFNDIATGASGTMLNGDIIQGGAVTAPDITAVSCSPISVQAPGTSICTAILSGGTPDAYAWAAQSCGTPARCTSASNGNPGTFTCTLGGACTLCLTATNSGGSDAMCASAISVRYVKPSGFGAN